ncbi:MAG: hypothetical protein AAGA54_34620 [Myxococcota bacterium]
MGTLLFALGAVACSFESGSDSGSGSASLGSSASETSDSMSDGPGSDDGSSGGDTADSQSGSDGSAITGDDPGTCEGPCAPDVPSGWDGPFYVAATEGDAAACPEGFPQQDVRFADLVAPDAMCTCACQAVESNCGVDYTLHLTGGCFGDAIGGTLGNGECDPYATLFPLEIFVDSTVTGTAGSCNPTTNDAVPDTSWETAVTVCMAPSGVGECEQGRCAAELPGSFDARLCISQPGEHECPGSGYADRQMSYTGVDDERACSTCECGTEGGECEVAVTGHANGNCTGSSSDLEIGTCDGFDVNTGDYGVSATIENKTPSCTASGGEPVGEATPTGAVTVCCAG